jgi:hypothetical protein
MKILKGKVDWKEGLANRPSLYLLVDEIPSRGDMRFQLHDKGGTIDGGLYFAERDGFCSFFSHHGSGNNGGFGGNKYDITMVDGSLKTLHGPWSSNAGEMNERGFGPCVEARFATDPTDTHGQTFANGAVLLSKLREAAHLIDVGSGFTWRPGSAYAAGVTFPAGSRFALACNGQVTIIGKDSRDYRFVARPEVFSDGALIENVRAAINAALALDGADQASPWFTRGQTRAIGHDLAYEIGERYRRHVPYEPIDTLLALSSYEPAVQFPDGEYWVKPATQ